jgi:hypothetical protein
MAGSSTNLDTISSSQAGKEITANALFDAGSPAMTFGRRASTTTGLTWGYYGGRYRKDDNTFILVANGTLLLDASTTNYVEVEKSTGVVSSNTTAFTVDSNNGYCPLYEIVTGSATITSYLDYRVGTQADGTV